VLITALTVCIKSHAFRRYFCVTSMKKLVEPGP
jgi:hypothetical protein